MVILGGLQGGPASVSCWALPLLEPTSAVFPHRKTGLAEMLPAFSSVDIKKQGRWGEFQPGRLRLNGAVGVPLAILWSYVCGSNPPTIE